MCWGGGYAGSLFSPSFLEIIECASREALREEPDCRWQCILYTSKLANSPRKKQPNDEGFLTCKSTELNTQQINLKTVFLR